MQESKNESSCRLNKRRFEEKDCSDKPKKNPQHEVPKLNPSNTISYVQILGTGMDTQDTSPSVLLFIDEQRFIFNAGEGLQRLCKEHEIKLSKIDHIFLSRVCSETAVGLPSLFFTLARSGKGRTGKEPSVNVWGPSGLKYLIDEMKSFVPPAAMVDMHSFGSSSSFEGATLPDLTMLTPLVLVDNEVVKISAILLKPKFSEGSVVKPGEISVIYVCELPEIMGQFDPEKTRALDLSSGPKYGDLEFGKSMQSDRGIMVHPSDTMDLSVPGPIVLLVDCPTGAHVLELLSLESLCSYYADCSAECAKTVNCIIHLSPTSVTSTPDYQEWLKRFGSAQHIMAGHEIKNAKVPILESSARLSTRLNYLCPHLFPASGFCSDSEVPVSRLSESISAANLLKFTLLPRAHLGLDRADIPSMVAPLEIINELLSEIPEIVDAAQRVSQIWEGPPETEEAIYHVHRNEVMIEKPWLVENRLPSCLENVRKDDLEIVLLGTGSAHPSKYRNVSSIYINLFSGGSLLLDCGEGTLGQLKRRQQLRNFPTRYFCYKYRYGVEGADSAVRNLSCIWISHIHADHQAGLARILALRHHLLKGVSHEPLLVVGPAKLEGFLDAYQRLEYLDMQFINCRYTTESSWIEFVRNSEINKDPSTQYGACFYGSDPQYQIDFANNNEDLNDKNMLHTESNQFDNSTAFPLLKSLKKVLSEAGLETLISVPVVHCQEAFGIVLKAAERINSLGKVIPGWKIVYSGDTRPCKGLTEASRGATVLIHEATFEDGMVEDAVAKKHSTTKEAIEVGSGAYRIVLTHFSQIYPKIPVVDDAAMHKTCIAFDLMSINLADLPVLPKVLPYFKLLFKDESNDLKIDT